MGVVIPGQLKLNVRQHDTGMAQGHALPVQGDRAMTLLVFGGMSKLEAAAIQIAAGLSSILHLQPGWHPEQPIEVSAKQMAKKAVDLAEALLIECAERQESRPWAAERDRPASPTG